MDLVGSFAILFFLLLGIGLGLTVFPKKWLKYNNILQTVGISLTLFTMGVSLGGSPTFLEDVKQAGWQGFLFAVVTVAGSTAAVYILVRLFLKGKEEKR